MANEEHLSILRRGIDGWNKWRQNNVDRVLGYSVADLTEANLLMADLGGADLHKANLHRANLTQANLREANLIEADLIGSDLGGANLNKAHLSKAKLYGANLTGANLTKANLFEAGLRVTYLMGANLIEANLSKANLREANLSGADLSKADLSKANLRGANLSKADFRKANFRGAKLEEAQLVETNLENAILADCCVYGISAWNLKLSGSQQTNLTITRSGEPAITVDNLEVAQFIYLLLIAEAAGRKPKEIRSQIGREIDDQRELLRTCENSSADRRWLHENFRWLLGQRNVGSNSQSTRDTGRQQTSRDPYSGQFGL